MVGVFSREDSSLPWLISHIEGLGTSINVFHAGTKLTDGMLVTSGGRVMAVSATADTLEQAVKKAYIGVSTIHFKDMFYRKDIAHRLVLVQTLPDFKTLFINHGFRALAC